MLGVDVRRVGTVHSEIAVEIRAVPRPARGLVVVQIKPLADLVREIILGAAVISDVGVESAARGDGARGERAKMPCADRQSERALEMRRGEKRGLG